MGALQLVQHVCFSRESRVLPVNLVCGSDPRRSIFSFKDPRLEWQHPHLSDSIPVELRTIRYEHCESCDGSVADTKLTTTTIV